MSATKFIKAVSNLEYSITQVTQITRDTLHKYIEGFPDGPFNVMHGICKEKNEGLLKFFGPVGMKHLFWHSYYPAIYADRYTEFDKVAAATKNKKKLPRMEAELLKKLEYECFLIQFFYGAKFDGTL